MTAGEDRPVRRRVRNRLGTGEQVAERRKGRPVVVPSVPPEVVVAVREGLGLTQAQFAALLFVSHTSIQRWERGANPPTAWGVVIYELLASVLVEYSARAVYLRASKARTPGGLVEALVRMRIELELYEKNPGEIPPSGAKLEKP